MTTADQPAFPAMDMNQHQGVDRLELRHEGLTKREYFAAMAMQTLVTSQIVADRDGRYDETNWKEVVAMNAIEFADELLRQLEATTK